MGSQIDENDVLRAISRVRVFVDYWNFQLSMGRDFPVDWFGLGQWMAQKACEFVGIPLDGYSFDGMNVYSSYGQGVNDPHYRWATGSLARQALVEVVCLPRQRRRAPVCQVCLTEIANCPKCASGMAGTQEKGVDTFIATDMIRLAWEEAYDIAVLATSDADLVPCVQYLGQRSKKVIQARFPPLGIQIAEASWASFDVSRLKNEIRRTT